jgi:hypothetical protein
MWYNIGVLDTAFMIAVCVSVGYGVVTSSDLPKNASDIVTALVASKLTAWRSNVKEENDVNNSKEQDDKG